MVCRKTIYVQKETKLKKYESVNEIHVPMDNNEIRISEEVSSKSNFKFTSGI